MDFKKRTHTHTCAQFPVQCCEWPAIFICKLIPLTFSHVAFPQEWLLVRVMCFAEPFLFSLLFCFSFCPLFLCVCVCVCSGFEAKTCFLSAALSRKINHKRISRAKFKLSKRKNASVVNSDRHSKCHFGILSASKLCVRSHETQPLPRKHTLEKPVKCIAIFLVYSFPVRFLD